METNKTMRAKQRFTKIKADMDESKIVKTERARIFFILKLQIIIYSPLCIT
jgi:hypothetical protein